jgi:putative addiction module component (TIGR02574 family)
MTEKSDAIVAEALSLPPLERAELIERLYDSLRSTEEADVERAWIDEAERRIDRFVAGESQVIPYEQLKQSLLNNDG